jgi:hypothetical protein
MTDPIEREGAPKARNEGDIPAGEEGEHWEGYPGAEPATSYPVVDRGRYKLLLFLLCLAFLGTAVAMATRQSENLPPAERPFSPR